MWIYFCILNTLYCIANAETYTTYYGVPAKSEEIADFQAKNISNICLTTFATCDKDEWSRVDGSCNSLKHPTHGMYHTPMYRMLPANYSADYEPRKITGGKNFPLARYIRTLLMDVGDTISEVFATSIALFAEFFFGDVGSVHDIRLYLRTITHCCKPEGLTDKRCTPNFIPVNDNVHRFSNVTCLNLTRPLSFQSTGCAPANTVPERINFVTTFFDISNLYYHAVGSILQNRAFKGGRLKVEVVEDGEFPSDANENTTCFLKDAVKTECTRIVPNGLIGTNLFTTYFWKFHNYHADALAKVNPCWDDETLFNNAKEINIAWYKQVLMYEFWPVLLGKENLIRHKIIGADNEFRDPYDEKVDPNLAIEFAYALRWFHSVQDGAQEMYDKNGKFIKTDRVVQYSLRVQDLAFNKTLSKMTIGICKQASGAFDQTVHPEISESGLGRLAQAFDILTADLARGRYFGFAPYSQYRDFCTNYTIKHEKFEDLKYIMKANKIDQLRRIYANLEDVELMAGIWGETIGEGSAIPPTVACIITKQLERSVASDRHWYERANRPHAFTAHQLKEIRKATLAGMLCAIGDGSSKIQKHAFLRVGKNNPEVSCAKIPTVNYAQWKDKSCAA